MAKYKIKFEEVVTKTYVAEIEAKSEKEAKDEIEHGDRFGYCLESNPIYQSVKVEILLSELKAI